MFDIKTFIEAEKGESPCLFQNKRQLNLTLSKKFPTLGILSHKKLKYALNIVYRQELWNDFHLKSLSTDTARVYFFYF